MSEYPPFSLEKPFYDQSTYFGRVRHFFSVVDPRTLFTTKQQVEHAKALLRDFEENKLDPSVTNEQLWRARRLKESCVHSDTGEMIVPFFRMAAFLPMNIPIAAGMVLSKPTMFNIVFWQWFNQTFNAGFNYANRSISKESEHDSVADIGKAYVSATLISVSLAVGLNQAVVRAKVGPTLKKVLQKTVPFAAVAAAGSCNAALMRYKDLTEGIEVFSPNGESFGRSVEAGKRALGQVIATRVALPVPVLLLPPVIIEGLSMLRFLPTGRGRAFADIAIVIACIGGAFPCAIGLFPQQATVPARKLEPCFHDLLDDAGRPIEHLTFNKGV